MRGDIYVWLLQICLWVSDICDNTLKLEKNKIYLKLWFKKYGKITTKFWWDCIWSMWVKLLHGIFKAPLMCHVYVSLNLWSPVNVIWITVFTSGLLCKHDENIYLNQIFHFLLRNLAVNKRNCVRKKGSFYFLL